MKLALKYIVVLALIAMLAGCMMWSNWKSQSNLCEGVEISILNADSSSFVDQESLARFLKDNSIAPKGKPLSEINTEQIENTLNKSDYLENVECVIKSNNNLLIKVWQIVPVMRVFDGNHSYYVNRRAKRMSATARFHKDVPVVVGHFKAGDTKSLTRLMPLLDYISNDNRLNALVTTIEVKDSCNVILVPDIYGHVINIGRPVDLDKKFEKLFTFYSKVMPEKGWNYYDTISVKWTDQVVATKAKKVVRTPQFDVNDDAIDESVDSSVLNNDSTSVKKAPDSTAVKPKPTEVPTNNKKTT